MAARVLQVLQNERDSLLKSREDLLFRIERMKREITIAEAEVYALRQEAQEIDAGIDLLVKERGK